MKAHTGSPQPTAPCLIWTLESLTTGSWHRHCLNLEVLVSRNKPQCNGIFLHPPTVTNTFPGQHSPTPASTSLSPPLHSHSPDTGCPPADEQDRSETLWSRNASSLQPLPSACFCSALAFVIYWSSKKNRAVNIWPPPLLNHTGHAYSAQPLLEALISPQNKLISMFWQRIKNYTTLCHSVKCSLDWPFDRRLWYTTSFLKWIWGLPIIPKQQLSERCSIGPNAHLSHSVLPQNKCPLFKTHCS